MNRIIPIYMGSTNLGEIGQNVLENHPHIHGEYVFLFPITSKIGESSPYTWGVHHQVNIVIHSIGIIPIYMGSTIRNAILPVHHQNHPHIHGEYNKMYGKDVRKSESSPYTWGVRVLRILKNNVMRIIPIYMGST